ncbi:MAG: MFS transporter [Hyphomonadaceae bacterium]
MNQIGFGVGGFGIALVYIMIGQLLFYFYTEFYGLTPAAAGGIIAIATFWDALVDPIMAWIVARTKTSIGRYRPYLIYGSLPMSLVFVSMFWRPDVAWIEAGALALITHMLFRTAYQVVYMPYTAMVTQLSRDADERSDLEAWRAWFLAVGILFVSFFGLTLVDVFGQGDDRRGFLWLALLIGLLSAASITFTGLVTKEADARVIEENDTTSPLTAIKHLARNRAFLVAVAGSMLCGIAITMFNKVMVDFFHYDLGDRSAARFALSASSAAGLIVSPFWAYLARKTGKRVAWTSGAALAATAAALAFFLDPRSVPVLCAIFFFFGAGLQAYLIIQFAAAADSVDYGEWKTGQRVEALGFGVIVFANKTSLAIGAALVGYMLTWFGFVPGQTQSPETLDGMRATMLLTPAFTLTLCVIVVSFFPVSTALHRRIQRELDERRAAQRQA